MSGMYTSPKTPTVHSIELAASGHTMSSFLCILLDEAARIKLNDVSALLYSLIHMEGDFGYTLAVLPHSIGFLRATYINERPKSRILIPRKQVRSAVKGHLGKKAAMRREKGIGGMGTDECPSNSTNKEKSMP